MTFRWTCPTCGREQRVMFLLSRAYWRYAFRGILCPCGHNRWGRML